MMELTGIENQLKKIAFLLGAIQGLAYVVMALICIVLHNKGEIAFGYSSNYMHTVNQNMYYIFLTPNEIVYRSFDYSLRPGTFTGFAWVYFFLHLGWIGVSVEASRKRGLTLPKYLTAWSHLTLLISVWDFITVVILGSDYDKCLKWANSYPSGVIIEFQGTCSTGILPALVIAAKGFVLWIVNVIFAVLLYKMAKKLKKGGGQVISQHVAVPIGFQPQQPVVTPQPSGYIPQSPRSVPYVPPTSQNVNRNQFDYPVGIPQPDYHYNQQLPSQTRRY